MYGFSWPVLVLRNPFLLKNLLISCFVTNLKKTGNMSFFSSEIALFHINCYFISKVSPMFMYGFLAGFSSPGSIFAEKVTYFLFCHHFQNTGNMSIFQKKWIPEN